MPRTGFVYIITNKNRNVLYVGVTNSIVRRLVEHKLEINRGFTQRYNCFDLVYYEVYETIGLAIRREKQLKNWKRVWKNELVEKQNPNWIDLSPSIGVTQEVLNQVRTNNLLNYK